MVLLATVALASALGPVRRALACWYDPIIFDPQALVEHVEQVAQLAQQVATAAEQVKGQLQSLAHLQGAVAPDVTGIVTALREQLDAIVYDSPAPAAQLDARYAANMASANWDQLQADQARWTQQERQALTENRQLQNQVYREMEATRQQVQRIVEASNAAPGETAAAQAHNDLLGVASAEIAKLQTLRAVRSRLRTERLAREQSELSFAAAEAERVRAGWDNPAAPSGGVGNPFQD